MKKIRIGWLLAGGMAIASTAGVYAHGGATGIVRERMEAMSAMGDAVKALSDMFRAGDYDAELVKQGAQTIAEHSGDALVSQFPEGTGGEPSEAKPAIWSDWNGFSALADDLSVLAAALLEKADNPDGNIAGGMGMSSGGMMGSGMDTGMMGGTGQPDPEMLAQMPVEAIFDMTVQTCASCHSKFRVED